MSGVSSVSGSGSTNYAEWLRLLEGRSGAQAANAASDQQAIGSNADAEPLNDLQQQIKEAVLQAIQDTDESGESADLWEVIKDAVDEVLEENGIDPEMLREQGKPPAEGMGGMPPPPPGMGGMPPGGPDAPSEEDSSCASNGSTSSSDASDYLEELIELLQGLLSQIQENGNVSNSASGLLFDQES